MQENTEYVQWILDSPTRLYNETNKAREALNRMYARATKVTSRITGMPGGGGSDSELLLAQLADARDTFDRLVFAEIAAREFVMKLIHRSGLPRRQRRMLYYRYIKGYTWAYVWWILNTPEIVMSQRTMYREHLRAIDTVAEYYKKGNFDEEDTYFVYESF